MKCPICGFWKLNDFLEEKCCKKCGYRFITQKKLNEGYKEVEKKV